MNSKQRPICQAVALAVFGLTAAVETTAQSIDDAGASEPQHRVIEEVQVTARRKEESLQEVPVAVSAMSAEDMADLQITSFGDVGITVPNLNVQTQFGSGSAPQFYLRGQATGLLSFEADSRIGLYIDGVYLGRAVAASFDLANTCHMEVARGPQGTLFGRNSTGGAINLRTCEPAEDFGGQVQVTGGDYDLRRVKGVVDSGIYNGFSARLTYMHTENDGYVNNRVAGTKYKLSPPFGTVKAADKFGEEDSDALGAALRFEGEDLTLDYRYDYTDKKNSQLGVQLLGIYDPGVAGLIAGSGGIAPSTDRLGSLPLDFTGTGSLDMKGHSVTAQYQLTDDLQVKNIWSYRKFKENTGGNDIDGNALDGAAIGAPGIPLAYISSINDRDQHQVSNEIQLLGDYGDIDFILGFFYFNENGEQNSPVFIGGLFIPPEPYQVGNISAFVPSDYFAGSITDVKNESVATYGNINYSLNDSWRFSLGLRHTDDDRTEIAQALGNYPPGTRFTADYNFDDYDGSVTYFVNDDINLYVKTGTAHLSGGILGGVPFDEEKITNYEFGVKSSLFDGAVRANAAIFHAKVDNVQTPSFTPETGTIIINTGDSEQDGFELEVTALLGEHWSVNATYGYLDFSQDNNTRSLAPENTAYLGVQYEFTRFSWGLLTARMDASWEDDAYGLVCPAGSLTTGDGCVDTEFTDMKLDNAVKLKANTQLGARISLAEIPIGGDYNGRVSLWGKNLLDTDELEFPRDLGNGTVVGTYQIPRTYGVDFELDF